MYIGKNIDRVDGWDKVTGRTKYIADYRMPDMLYGLTVRAPVSKGRLKDIKFDKNFNLFWSTTSSNTFIKFK